MDDRRIFGRISARFPLKFLNPSDGSEGIAETVDVSANGLGILSKIPLPVRTPLEFWLDIPDQHEPLYTRGQVVWSRDSSDTAGQQVGVQLERAELMGLARVLWHNRRLKSS